MNDMTFKNDFPILMQGIGGDPTQTCMSWGLEVPMDWMPILYSYCHLLEEINRKGRSKVVAEQVKSKWGELRFYYRVVGEPCDLAERIVESMEEAIASYDKVERDVNEI